jgi:hypothetical protein
LARFLGGRHVLGSGKTWPHDFLFFVGLLSSSSSASWVSGSTLSDEHSGEVRVESVAVGEAGESGAPYGVDASAKVSSLMYVMADWW